MDSVAGNVAGNVAGIVEQHDPHFTAVTSAEFDRAGIAELAAGRRAATRVPGFASPAMCAEVLEALTEAEFESYGAERVSPRVMRFGVGVSDHRDGGGGVSGGYWEALEGGVRGWQGLSLPFDPFRFCRDGIGKHWPGEVVVGRRGGRELGAGVAREPGGGFVVHYDDASREFSGNLLDVALVAQFAFNLYLSVPESGGETVVWRHRWQPGDEEFRPAGSYGYREEVVGSAESFTLRPRAGEALLFDPRNYHAVRPSSGGRRIALGFSVGLTDEGDLHVWA
ncbi:2OG-Fe(II) oxygenase [Actinosynnema mirum]|uniref:2OG-Fe(II)-dependent halogenase WelO5 family protein n=1 Tax=Actinosynnema mirum TaxID=40567 RepID=UPI0002FC74B9|nr:2OG-Fe(II) oxygenase [Actinosynnema mirum]